METAIGSFEWALQHLKNGARVARSGGNGKGMWIALQVPDKDSKMDLPYLFISTIPGWLIPWVPSQIDILADDWELVDEG